MFGQGITAGQLAAVREACGGVCVIPIGCPIRKEVSQDKGALDKNTRTGISTACARVCCFYLAWPKYSLSLGSSIVLTALCSLQERSTR